jgi:urate oxidase
MTSSHNLTISYGKMCVPVYRVYANPLSGFTAIPESAFTKRENILFALEVDIEVLGNNFLPAYTDGDNTNVVATDSMKNFVLQQALDFTGSTLEEFLNLLGHRFLATYPQMERLSLTGRELPFVPVSVPQQDTTFDDSNVLFRRSHGDFAIAMLEFARDGDHPVITTHRCGRSGLELFKVTGSAFSHFVRDEFTTLLERRDRPLFIYLDVYWKYNEVAALLAHNH